MQDLNRLQADRLVAKRKELEERLKKQKKLLADISSPPDAEDTAMTQARELAEKRLAEINKELEDLGQAAVADAVAEQVDAATAEAGEHRGADAQEVGASLSISPKPEPEPQKGDPEEEAEETAEQGISFDVEGVSKIDGGYHANDLNNPDQREAMVKAFIKEQLESQAIKPDKIDKIMQGDFKEIGAALVDNNITIDMHLKFDNPNSAAVPKAQKAMQEIANDLGKAVNYNPDPNVTQGLEEKTGKPEDGAEPDAELDADNPEALEIIKAASEKVIQTIGETADANDEDQAARSTQAGHTPLEVSPKPQSDRSHPKVVEEGMQKATDNRDDLVSSKTDAAEKSTEAAATPDPQPSQGPSMNPS